MSEWWFLLFVVNAVIIMLVYQSAHSKGYLKGLDFVNELLSSKEQDGDTP